MRTGNGARPALVAAERPAKLLQDARLANGVAHVHVALDPLCRKAGREGLPVELRIHGATRSAAWGLQVTSTSTPKEAHHANECSTRGKQANISHRPEMERQEVRWSQERCMASERPGTSGTRSLKNVKQTRAGMRCPVHSECRLETGTLCVLRGKVLADSGRPARLHAAEKQHKGSRIQSPSQRVTCH